MNHPIKTLSLLVFFMFVCVSFSYAADPPKQTGYDKYGKPLPTTTNAIPALTTTKPSPIPVVQTGPGPISNATIAPGATSATRPLYTYPDSYHFCPEGYWCRTANGRFPGRCQLGTPPFAEPVAGTPTYFENYYAKHDIHNPRYCDDVARYCETMAEPASQERGVIYNSYCSTD